MGEEDMDLDAEARSLAKQRATASTSRATEADCKRCGRKTPQDASGACLRCRELDAEAAKIIEARQRTEEIHRRANAFDNPMVRAEIAANKKKYRWQNISVLIVATAVTVGLMAAGDGDPFKGAARIWLALASN